MGRGVNDGQALEYRPTVRVTARLALPLSEFRFRVSRSSGPGGQHANKSETKVEALFDVDSSQTLTDTQKARLKAKIGPVVKAVSQDERSQLRNKEKATERVAALIAEGLKTRRKRLKTEVPQAVKEKRLSDKRRRSDLKGKRGRVRAGADD